LALVTVQKIEECIDWKEWNVFFLARRPHHRSINQCIRIVVKRALFHNQSRKVRPALCANKCSSKLIKTYTSRFVYVCLYMRAAKRDLRSSH